MDDQESDRLREIRHALKNRLSVLRGWWQLIRREDGKPDPSPERRERYAMRLDAAILELADDIDRRLGPAATGRPAGEQDRSPAQVDVTGDVRSARDSSDPAPPPA